MVEARAGGRATKTVSRSTTISRPSSTSVTRISSPSRSSYSPIHVGLGYGGYGYSSPIVVGGGYSYGYVAPSYTYYPSKPLTTAELAGIEIGSRLRRQYYPSKPLTTAELAGIEIGSRLRRQYYPSKPLTTVELAGIGIGSFVFLVCICVFGRHCRDYESDDVVIVQNDPGFTQTTTVHETVVDQASYAPMQAAAPAPGAYPPMGQPPMN